MSDAPRKAEESSDAQNEPSMGTVEPKEASTTPTAQPSRAAKAVKGGKKSAGKKAKRTPVEGENESAPSTQRDAAANPGGKASKTSPAVEKTGKGGGKTKTAKGAPADRKGKEKKGDKGRGKKAEKGPTRLQTGVRYAAVAVYVLLVALGFFWDGQTRLFWTIALPLIPLLMVLIGFHHWRRICPLAYWGELGLKAKKGEVKRVPKWLEANFFRIAFGILLTMMLMRLMFSNGNGIWLSGTLMGLGGAAFYTNFHFTGKTWCNFICPVGMVERIYTEPNSLPKLDQVNSQCTKCTACKKNCPDIDQENAYWKDIDSSARRMAYFSFPGLVVAFYTYYYLRIGSWSHQDGAYFNGSWTNQQAGWVEHVFTGNGFFFAAWVPPIVAALVTLVAFSVISFHLFSALERYVIVRFKETDEERRHLTMTIAAFSAFNLFYVWAGAPSILSLDSMLGGPWLTRTLAFGIPLVSTLFFVKRYQRSKAVYLQERGAQKLLKKWTFDEPPPKSAGEIFAFFKAQESAHEAQLSAYRETIIEVLSDGLVTEDEMRLLEQLRAQLNITEKEHRKIFKTFSDEQQGLFAADKTMSVEKRLQLEGYKVALSMVLMRDERASRSELEVMRLEYGIERADHDSVLAELRGDSSPVLARAERTFEQIDVVRQKLEILSPMSQSGEFAFLIFVFLKQQDHLVDRIIDALCLYSEEPELIPELRSALFVADKDARQATLDSLRKLTDIRLVDRLEPVIMKRRPRGGQIRQSELKALLLEMLESADIYQRAGAVFASAQLQDPAFKEPLIARLADPNVLVRETAVYACLVAQEVIEGRALLEAMVESDPEFLVRRAARDVLDALASGKKHEFHVTAASDTGRFVAPPIPDSRLSSLAAFEKILFLRCVPIFADLDPEDLHEISAFTDEVRIEADGTICRQGDTDTDAYVIVTGWSRVLIERDGKEMEVAKLGPGDVLGELAAIDGHSRSATVKPKSSPVRLLRIPGDTFRHRIATRPDVAPMIMATLTGRLRDTLAQVRSTIRDVLADGQVDKDEVDLLDKLRHILEDSQVTDSEQGLYNNLRELLGHDTKNT